MLLNENLFEPLNEETSDRNKVGGKEIAKQQAIREMANLDFEVGHIYDPDDFDYFKRVCGEDGWNVTEEDFQKYFEYLDEIRANQFADEDDIDLGDWEEMESKQVEDSEKFGSGRFCSRACANTRIHSAETKDKIRSGLAKTTQCFCQYCGKEFSTLISNWRINNAILSLDSFLIFPFLKSTKESK